MKLRKLLLVALLLIATGSVAQQLTCIENDPTVRTGKLPNGLTYYIKQNNWPEHRVNFYIAQRVGSLQEEESQRGLAHFLEHMAFNGSEHFSGNGVIDYTRSIGVEFGRDMNAYTSVDQTVYNINDVPSTRESAIDSCLLILKDWANGLLLEDEEIDKERGVIHEEWRLSSTADQRMLERNLETLYPGSKYGLRMPIGLMSVVDNFKYDELRDYYHRWYRPDNQAIVVVGDIDVDRIEAKIIEIFGAIPAPGADAPQVVDEPVPDNAEPIIVIDKDREQEYNVLWIMYKTEPFPIEMKSDLSYYINNYIINMACTMLDSRLSEKTLEEDCPYLEAYAGRGSYLFSKTKDAFELTVVPKDNMTNEAVKAVYEEALRAAQYGFVETEYMRAKDDYLSGLEQSYNNRNQTYNVVYGARCYANYLNNEPYPSIEWRYPVMNMLVPTISLDMINECMREMMPQNDSNLVILNFNKESAQLPTSEGLMAAINSARSENLEPYVDNVRDEPLISEMPQPGKIVSETKNETLGYTELTLSNGAKVLLKPTDFMDDEIRYSALSKGGSSLYGKEDYANIEMFSEVIENSGFGNFSNNELEKALAGKNLFLTFMMSTYYENFFGFSTKKDLETLFQLNYLYFTNINKDEKAVGSLMSVKETDLKAKGTTPDDVFGDSISCTIGNHNWRSKPFVLDDLKDVSYDRILQIAKERTANAADFTFCFVGSFDMDSIKPLIEQYIASLPSSDSREDFIDVDNTPQGIVVNEFSHKMETPKTNTLMFWHSYLAPNTLENQLKAKIAGDVLDMILLKKIREDEGAAYTTNAFGSCGKNGHKAVTTLIGMCPMKPEKKDIVMEVMHGALNEMANGIDEGDLNKIKEKMLKNFDTNLKQNHYWSSVIMMFATEGMDVYTNYKDILNNITCADISNFVREYIINSGNRIEVTMTPEE